MDAEVLLFLIPPLVACLVLTGIHAYLGIHVLARGVIFVDIALAQIAAVGTTVAFLTGHDIHGATAYFYSLGFTFLGAAVFALSRDLRKRVPQEAFIGITYAVASAVAILIVDKAPQGTEHIKQMLIGDLLWVTPGHVALTAGIYSAIGLFHFFFRKKFLLLSFEPEAADSNRRSALLWDLAFYMSFGFVITSSVQIAGVLLVFSFLIVPAVFAAMFVDSGRIGRRLVLSWAFGSLVSLLGIAASYLFDLPTGAAIVAVFGLLLAVSIGGRFAMGRRATA